MFITVSLVACGGNDTNLSPDRRPDLADPDAIEDVLQNPPLAGKGPFFIHTTAEFELDPLDENGETPERGLVTYPLYHGTIAATGNRVFFVLSDISEQGLAEEWGVLHARTFPDAFDEGVEDGATYSNGEWVFQQDPGRMVHEDCDDPAAIDDPGDQWNSDCIVRAGDGSDFVAGESAQPNLDYSPLKRVNYEGREVFVNAPFIQWGPHEAERIKVDTGGCRKDIRMSLPNPFYVGMGPGGCENDVPIPGKPIGFERYRGGQATSLDIPAECNQEGTSQPCGTVTMKLHKGQHREDVHPYYTVFEASKAPGAESRGVIYAPKLAKMGRMGESKAVANIMQFGNGLGLEGIGGPSGHQPGLTAYGSAQWNNYTPMWHITFAFYDCDDDGVFFTEDKNVSAPYGAVPMAGSGIERFDPAVRDTFDPFNMDDKGATCIEYARKATDHPTGRIFAGFKQDMIDRLHIVETEAPPGWTGEGGPPILDLERHQIVNCPTPVSFQAGREIVPLP
jgi:hypothetical protein